MNMREQLIANGNLRPGYTTGFVLGKTASTKLKKQAAAATRREADKLLPAAKPSKPAKKAK